MRPTLAQLARTVAVAACAASALTLFGCGETAVIDPTPIPTPTPPPKAIVQMGISNLGVDSSLKTHWWTLVLDLSFQEFANVKADVVTIRVDVYDAGDKWVERTDVNTNTIAGSDAIPAKGTLQYPALKIGYNSYPTKGRYLIISADIVDANGNRTTLKSGVLAWG